MHRPYKSFSSSTNSLNNRNYILINYQNIEKMHNRFKVRSISCCYLINTMQTIVLEQMHKVSMQRLLKMNILA